MAGVWPTEDGMEYGVLGVWSMEYGVWSMEYGVWSMEYGVWSMDRKGPLRRPQSKKIGALRAKSSCHLTTLKPYAPGSKYTQCELS